MRLPLLFSVLLLLLFAAPGARAQSESFLEERFALQHMTPSKMAERLELLTAGGNEETRNLQVVPQENSRTLLVKIRRDDMAELERQRLRFLARELIQLLDQPRPEIAVTVHAVQTQLLSDQEFRDLDERLKQGPLDYSRGGAAKGMIYWGKHTGNEQDVIAFNDIQGRMSGQIISGPTTVAGRLLPDHRADGSIGLYVELTMETRDGYLVEGKQELKVTGKAGRTNQRPLVISAGKGKPIGDADRQVYPQRHELMIYIWTEEVEEDGQGS